jgi:hypothetical protein
MSNEFWLGLALGLPLSILGNVITRPVQSYLDSRIRSRALRRAREERRYTEEAKRLTEHPQDFHAALLYSVGFIGYWIMVLILGVLALSLVILRGAQYIRESPVWLVITAFCFLAVIYTFRSIERQAR